jgi:hypothetical protein
MTNFCVEKRVRDALILGENEDEEEMSDIYQRDSKVEIQGAQRPFFLQLC